MIIRMMMMICVVMISVIRFGDGGFVVVDVDLLPEGRDVRGGVWYGGPLPGQTRGVGTTIVHE